MSGNSRVSMLGRALVALAALLLSFAPLALGCGWVVAAIHGLIHEGPSWAAVQALAYGLPLVCAWFVFLLLTGGWVINRKMRRRWVASGIACGAIALLILVVVVHEVAEFMSPLVLLAVWVCWFHVERQQHTAPRN